MEEAAQGARHLPSYWATTPDWRLLPSLVSPGAPPQTYSQPVTVQCGGHGVGWDCILLPNGFPSSPDTLLPIYRPPTVPRQVGLSLHSYSPQDRAFPADLPHSSFPDSLVFQGGSGQTGGRLPAPSSSQTSLYWFWLLVNQPWAGKN